MRAWSDAPACVVSQPQLRRADGDRSDGALLYGSDLPKVIRSWGKRTPTFARNLNGIRSELNDAIYAEPDSPRKLQYYPEFQHDASDADEGEADDHDSPVARAAAEAEKVADSEAAGDEALRHDTHGAA